MMPDAIQIYIYIYIYIVKFFEPGRRIDKVINKPRVLQYYLLGY